MFQQNDWLFYFQIKWPVIIMCPFKMIGLRYMFQQNDWLLSYF